ncbi:MAG TPA: histidine phosphatase family protein [Vicinamibacteria bacterium]|nr:histidine phosphatase family protein [Vicinamibacteria bacterium]
MPRQRVFLIRHGETAWTLSGQHTGTTDIPLTENGRWSAQRLSSLFFGVELELVLTSPLQRARETCRLAGLGDGARIDRDLLEWNYGEFEGLTTEEIRSRAPKWVLFVDGCPGGESPCEVGARVDRVIARVRERRGDAALFAHGHFFRVFAARWLGLPVQSGRHFLLDPATVSILSDYHGIPAIERWNAGLC